MTEVTVFTAGDNIPMLHALERDSKEVSIHNSVAKTKILAAQIIKKYKGIAIHFTWLPGPKKPEDYSSKEVDDPLSTVDSLLWREEPLEFTNYQ